jgi:periplasmic nitrate reductase NapD
VTEELHISSLVVHSTPKRVRLVSDAIAAIEGALVHATSPGGKLVVTLEADSSDEMFAKVMRIQQTDGVLSAALVYECVDTLDAMNEVIPDADDPKGIH